MASNQQAMETAPVDLGSLLDAGDGAVATLVAGDTRLVAHRAVLVERSPVFAAMFGHDTLEAGSGEVSIPDVEGAVLRQLLAFLYTLRAPQLADMASPLLVAADKYGVSALKAACEQQVAAQLSVETAAAAAVLAVRHSCQSLRETAINFVRTNFLQVTRTQGWADAIRMQPEDVIEVSRFLSDPPAESRPIQQTKETALVDLASLLDAGDSAVVTLVAGDTRLAVHRAVLVERSPVFAAMFGHDTLEAGSGEVSIPDVEGGVLRQLLAFLYTQHSSQLPEMAFHLLAPADKYGVSALKATCEQQVAAQLSVETAAAAAVLAVRHSCQSLRETAINFVRANFLQVTRTQGWADAIRMQPEDVIEVSRLLSDPPAESSDIVMGTLEAGSSEVLEGAVLRQLLAFLYTLQAPQVLDLASPLLVVADKYGVSALKAVCEQQVAAQLTVETAAAAAVLAVRQSCQSLRKTAIDFVKANLDQVMVSQGWADAIRMQPEDVIEVTQLLFNPQAESRSLAAEEKGRRLIKAAQQGAVAELEEMLAAGADVAATDGYGRTALHCAADRGHVEAARRLVASGAPLEAKNKWDATPLHRAAFKGHAAVVRLLLAASAYHSARRSDGWTPLHLAAAYGHAEVAAALLEAGASREARTNRGETPLDAARQNNKQQLVDLLSGR